MPEDYKRITRILVWVVSISMIAYFVITPFTYFRQTPQRTSPSAEEITPTTTEESAVQPQIQSQSQSQSFPTTVPSNLLPDNQLENSTTQ